MLSLRGFITFAIFVLSSSLVFQNCGKFEVANNGEVNFQNSEGINIATPGLTEFTELPEIPKEIKYTFKNFWEDISNINAPDPRIDHAAIWTGDEVIIWGGLGGDNLVTLNSGGAYNPKTKVWRAIELTGAPSPRVNHTAIWTGEEMIIWGGFVEEGGAKDELVPVAGSPGIVTCAAQKGNSLGDGAAYNPVTGTWRAISKINAPSPRSSHTAVWTGKYMIIWGGGITGNAFSDGKIYDPATDIWKSMSDVNSPLPRVAHDSTWTGSELIIWGGSPNLGNYSRTLASGAIYNLAEDSWRAFSSTPTQEIALMRHHGCGVLTTGKYAAYVDKKIVFWSIKQREDKSGNVSGYTYSLEGNSWEEISFSELSELRHVNQSIVSSGTQVFAFGGWGGNSLNYGGVYDTISHLWQPMDTVNAPDYRWGMTLTLIGDGVFVWGGSTELVFSNSGRRNDGAIFR